MASVLSLVSWPKLFSCRRGRRSMRSASGHGGFARHCRPAAELEGPAVIRSAPAIEPSAASIIKMAGKSVRRGGLVGAKPGCELAMLPPMGATLVPPPTNIYLAVHMTQVASHPDMRKGRH